METTITTTTWEGERDRRSKLTHSHNSNRLQLLTQWLLSGRGKRLGCICLVVDNVLDIRGLRSPVRARR